MLAFNLSKREKNVLLIGATIVLVIILFNFVIDPLILRFQGLSQRLTANEIRLRKNLKILSNKKNIQAEYDKYVDFMKQKTSDEQEMSSLLSNVEKVAQELNIRITDMKPRRVKTKDFYKDLSLELEAEGLLGEITEFIYAIQNSPYLLSVEKLRLEKRSSRKPQLKTSLLISKILIP